MTNTNSFNKSMYLPVNSGYSQTPRENGPPLAFSQFRSSEIIKYKKDFTNSLGMKFVYIKPGTFNMGPLNEPSIGGTITERHKVTLTKGFYMQTTETTVGSFKKFVKETNYKTQAEKDKRQKIYYFSKTNLSIFHDTYKRK